MELIVIPVIVYLVYRLVRRRDPVDDVAGVVGPVGWSAGTDWRVVRPLARADLRRVLLHPAFIVGVALTPLMLLAASDGVDTWRAASGSTALALVPLGWLTIIATNLVTLRPRRTGAAELFATLPAPQPARTTALLATMIGPVLVALVFAVAWMTVGPFGSDLRGSPAPLETAAGLLIAAGAVCVGVAVARWLPNALFGVAAVFVVILIQARFLDVTTWPWNRSEGDPMRFLGFLAMPTHVGEEFLEVRPAGWHLVYLVGLVALMAAVALARDGLGRPARALLVAALLVAAGAGWMQTRPLTTTQEARMVSFLIDPASHQICDDSTGVRYCAYPSFRGDLAGWRARVEATMAVLPASVAAQQPSFAVIQRPPTIIGNSNCSPIEFEQTLPPGVAAQISKADLWPADAAVHPSFGEEAFPCGGRNVHGFFLAVQTGAWAVGLPPAPHDANERCVASDQARSAIALWAAAAASRDGERTLRDVVADGASPDGLIRFRDWNSPPMWGVDYSVADAAAALAMLELPIADVRSTLEGDWDRWTDPATPTGSLTGQLGVDVASADVAGAAPTCA